MCSNRQTDRQRQRQIKMEKEKKNTIIIHHLQLTLTYHLPPSSPYPHLSPPFLPPSNKQSYEICKRNSMAGNGSSPIWFVGDPLDGEHVVCVWYVVLRLHGTCSSLPLFLPPSPHYLFPLFAFPTPFPLDASPHPPLSPSPPPPTAPISCYVFSWLKLLSLIWRMCMSIVSTCL